nr:MAG TPA: tail fiber protein [Bacteriophage sp.]
MINIAIKLATSITYTADGSQTNFSIPFDYLRPSFVHVAVNDAEVSEGFTVSNRGIMFDTAPAKDALVKIYRKTPTSRLVSWADASILKAIDMTIAEVQQLHILEETSDWTKTNSMALNDEGTAWQGWKHRIENVADPVDAQDVVTKHYLDNEEGSFTATMNALKTKTEEAASTAETNAKQARFNAEKADSAAVGAERDAATALKSANNAKTSETNADTSKEAAQTAATNAGNFATSASQSANEAQNYRDAAKNYATNAKNYSENVNVFVPSVSTDGVLSWSNKAGLTNPPSVNIKGKDGADGGVTVDDALSDTSTNAIQNKVVKAALDNRAVLDEANTFTSPNRFDDIYMADGMSSLKWYNGSPNFVVASINSERYTGEANTAKKASKDSAGNVITDTYATKTELNSCVKTVNNVAPDASGNVNITASGGGSSSNGVSLSAQNTWTAQQTFDIALLEFEKYVTAYDSGTSLTPMKSTAVYTATGNFTLDLTTDTYLLSNGQSQVLTVYIKSSADYALTLKGAGTVKYIGAASDLAITSTGLLLNILMMSDSSGGITSIVQASKLS